MQLIVYGFLFSVICLLKCDFCDGSCYFSQEYQGEYVIQNTAAIGRGLQYSTLNITDTSISIWGNCHRQIKNKFILTFNIGSTSCVRCLYLKLRSSNILQAYMSSQETLSQCYTNDEIAEKHCPSENTLHMKNTTEIILFKTKHATGMPTSNEYCPFNGKYSVIYDDNEDAICENSHSMLETCPIGSSMKVILNSCSPKSTPSNEINFKCLGNWASHKQDIHYVAFQDNRYLHGTKPLYRCAIYHQAADSDIIRLTISSDSTCNGLLDNSTSKLETYTLLPKTMKPWPPEVEQSACTFPTWMHGSWANMKVNANSLIYRDYNKMKTYTIRCLGEEMATSKYLIYSRTECNEAQYNCMKVVNRTPNILELQFGINSSTIDDFSKLCSPVNFPDDYWITQEKLDKIVGLANMDMCPITGEYTGVIPDNTELCAKLWSDCRAPDLMYYQVSHCESNEIYEEREYKCLGHWNEASLLYTYTQRRDISSGPYECFVGAISSENEIHIKEAGEHCQRRMDPLLNGMKLIKKQLFSCISRDETTKTHVETNSVNVNYTSVPRTYSKTPTTDWKPDTEVQDEKNSISSGYSSSKNFYHNVYVAIILFKTYLIVF